VTHDRRSQSITVSAKTVAEAIAEAEQRLDLPQDEIDITVISEGSKGFLGMGGESARILAMPKAILARRSVEMPRPAQPPEPVAVTLPPAPPSPIETPPAPAVPAQPVARLPETPVDRSSLDGEDSAEDLAATVPGHPDSAQVAQAALEVVRELLERMSIDALATVRSAGNPVEIDITGHDLGLLIGRHGDTLSALQYLVNAIVGKRVHRWCKVIIDVEQYRVRREDTLRSLANRQAARVRQSHQEIALDPMPAAERRIVHLTLQNSPWVVTSSIGEEPNRKVVIAPRQVAR
jgi:spoIIIJ-associated protein